MTTIGYAPITSLRKRGFKPPAFTSLPSSLSLNGGTGRICTHEALRRRVLSPPALSTCIQYRQMANTAQLAYAIFRFEGGGFSLSYVFITLAGFAPASWLSKSHEIVCYSIGFFARYVATYSLYESGGKGKNRTPSKAFQTPRASFHYTTIPL